MKMLIFGLLVLTAMPVAVAAPAPDYQWILKDKLRGGYLSSSDPRTIAARAKAAGMNALLPKFGGLHSPATEADVQLLREWGQAASDAGLHLLPVINFRGGGDTERILGERREMTPKGRHMVQTPCPLDESFWHRYLLDRAVALAERAKELHLDGVIIDPEMYGAEHTAYTDLCYCDDCLREFLQAEGQPAAVLPDPAARATWLTDHGLSDRFQQHFEDRVRGFCAEIEREVHQRNPDFLLGVLHLDEPLLFNRAMAEGLGTETHPVLGFSERTYSPGYTPYVEEAQRTFAAFPAHVLFIPGLWISQFPVENLAEQCYACARASHGYWIYTFESLAERPRRGYTAPASAEPYWEAMKTANSELDRLLAAGAGYVSTLKVRPFEKPLRQLSMRDIGAEQLAPAREARPVSVGPEALPRLRYRNPLYVLAKAGEPVEVRVTSQQLNVHYTAGTQWIVADPQGRNLLEGHMKVCESAVVKWTPAQDGVFAVLADSDDNGHSLRMVTRQPTAYKASQRQPLRVNGALGRLYFYVPDGVTGFSLFVKADGQAEGRGGRLAVIAPNGQVAARASGDLDTLTEVRVQVPAAMQHRVWALTAEDVTNDLNVSFSPNMPPYVGTNPARLLVDRKFLTGK